MSENQPQTYTTAWKTPGFLSGSTLKILACISMFTDHSTVILWRKYKSYISTLDYADIMHYQNLYHLGRNIGRAAFPIFCFLLVEGLFHTKSTPKYLARLLMMAVLSEHAFNLLHSGSHLDLKGQSVYLTLFISLLTITVIDRIRVRFTDRPDTCSALIILATGAGCLLAWILKTDYSYKGVLAVVIMYLLHYFLPLECAGGALAFTWEPWALTAFLPIFFYNGKRGLKIKYFFYFFYPVHIYLIYYVVTYMLPDTF